MSVTAVRRTARRAPGDADDAPGGERVAARETERWPERMDRGPAGGAHRTLEWGIEDPSAGGTVRREDGAHHGVGDVPGRLIIRPAPAMSSAVTAEAKSIFRGSLVEYARRW